MNDDTEPSRSERLRQRRSQRSDRVADRSESADTPPAATAPGKESDPDAAETTEESASIKDEQVGTYMYIPESQKRELQRCYNVLKAEYEYEFDTTFEKNRHFYPLLVQYGLDGLESFDITEIQERLESIEMRS